MFYERIEVSVAFRSGYRLAQLLVGRFAALELRDAELCGSPLVIEVFALTSNVIMREG